MVKSNPRTAKSVQNAKSASGVQKSTESGSSNLKSAPTTTSSGQKSIDPKSSDPKSTGQKSGSVQSSSGGEKGTTPVVKGGPSSAAPAEKRSDQGKAKEEPKKDKDKDNRLSSCPVPASRRSKDKKRSKSPSQKTSPPSQGASQMSASQTSVLGKMRVPTLIVNPADMPTTRGGSDKSTSWANVTIGGRRRPSKAETQNLAAAEIKRTKEAVRLATIVATVVLILVVVLGLSLWFSLSLPAPTQATPTVAVTKK